LVQSNKQPRVSTHQVEASGAKAAGRANDVVTGQSAGARLRGWSLLLLTLTYAFSFLDRTIVLTLGEALKKDMQLTDGQLGFLGGTTFAVFYGLLTIPIARLAERRSRVGILTACLVIWSLMTALCGSAQSFFQLVVARIGVGTGEAGGQPTSHSLISDLYPAERRATATALFQLGVPLGILVGAVAGGWITQNVSWRAAFVAVGLPGLALALLVRFTMPEPARGGADGAFATASVAPAIETVPPPSLMDVIRRLGRSSVFFHVIMGGMLAAIAGNGINQFMHSFFLRNYGLGYATGALVFGVIQSVSIAAGTLIGGFASDRLGNRKPWMQPVTPAICLAIGGPLATFGFGQAHWTSAAAIILVSGVFTATFYAPIYTITHALLEPRMRATGAAILTVGLGLVSLGLGPLLAGAASDAFAATHYAGSFAVDCKVHLPATPLAACAKASASGLADALMAWSLIYVWAAVHFGLAARALARRPR
jgi:MFS family permease